jgi:hypothetical protein
MMGLALPALADSTINVDDKYAYGANVGWINARGDITNGAVIGEFMCSGNLYGANIGWIHLGSGSPTNGVRYGNASADDYGVNNDGLGNLSGYAYGANIGWVNFETNFGKPKVNLLTGDLDGYAWGANVGWISLSNAQAFVQTDTLGSGPDTDGDGIPDQWELSQVSSLTTLTATADYDHDGISDKGEYASDTRANDINSHMEIVDYDQTAGTNVYLAWSSEPTRFYRLDRSSGVTNGAPWSDTSLGLIPPEPPPAAETSRSFTDSGATQGFYRVRAVRPLSP